MKKKLSVLALIGASALVLSGCNNASTPNASNTETPAPAETGTETQAPADGGTVTVWLVGADTPATARDYLKSTFAAENPGWEIEIVEKTWADVSETYVADLSSNDAPDVVEVGNTQALGFADQGLFEDISDIRDEIGADKLLGGLVDAGTYEGGLYAAPYYAGGRIVFYSPETAPDPQPTTLEEFVNKGIELTTDTKSGIYAPGKDWYNALPYIWAYGGEIAVQDGDQWDAQFSSPESQEGLALLQKVYTSATKAPADANELNANVAFCEGNAGYISSPAWVEGNLNGSWPWDSGDGVLTPEWEAEAAKPEADQNFEGLTQWETPPTSSTPGCADTFAKGLTAMALPGKEAGTAAPIFAGGSNIAIAAKSDAKDQAKAALKIILSEGYQNELAKVGLTPGLLASAASLPDTAIAKAQAAALANSKFTPTSPNWAEVEKAAIIPEALVNIATGGDIKAIAEKLDADIEAILNK